MSDELTLVPYRSKGSIAALVFIHGFSGDASKTWGKFPEYLLQQANLSDWDVFSFGYRSSLALDIVGIWSADAPLTTLADLLQTRAANSPIDKYRTVAFVAHSMGGLVLQRALLDDRLKDRTSHVVLFGTPSAGVAKSSPFSFWKRQLRDMGPQSEFIRELRKNWEVRFGKSIPFKFWTVAGDRDEFVPRTSSLDPFPPALRAVVPGDHLQIVKPRSADDLSVQLVVKTLAGDAAAAGEGNSARVAVEMCEFREAVRVLEPLQDDLEEDGLVQLALALEGVGRQQDAITVLERAGRKGTDALGVFAGRLKRRWYVERRKADIERAYKLYEKGYRISAKKRDHEQAFYHGINLAFLDIAYRKNLRAAKIKAKRVLDHCKKARHKDHWAYASLGDANLILGDVPNAVNHYRQALSLNPGPRERGSIHQQAYRLADLLKIQNLAVTIDQVFREE